MLNWIGDQPLVNDFSSDTRPVLGIVGSHASLLATIKACLCGQLAPHSLKISDCLHRFELREFILYFICAYFSYPFYIHFISTYLSSS